MAVVYDSSKRRDYLHRNANGILQFLWAGNFEKSARTKHKENLHTDKDSKKAII